jgi:riboflavin synthase
MPAVSSPAQRSFMFTGIIEETGIVRSIGRTTSSIHLMVEASLCSRNMRPGDSLAVNGCCLTAVKIASRSRSRLVQFDLLRETWERTNLRFTRTGSLVNLERALRADGRLGGHFVTGHVDGIGRIVSWEQAGSDHLLDIEAPPDIMRYLVLKDYRR